MSEQSQVVNITTAGGRYDQGSYGRGYYGNQRAAHSSASTTGNKQTVKKKNPVGVDGHLLTCKSCGSFRHFIGDCPDNLGNLAKVHVVEDEHFVLFTDYHRG